MKTAALLLALLSLSAAAYAAEPERPHWSLELKGGAFFPGASDWSTYYGKSYMAEFGAAAAYKVYRQLEIGVEAGYGTATGKASAPLNGIVTGQVTYEVVPVGVFLLARGIFSEDQLLVPYAGGGWNRTFYWQRVQNQGNVKGSVNGYYGRTGLQLLLDGIDRDSSRNLYDDYGIRHSYLFAEGKFSRADATTVTSGTADLGGTSWLGGFLFEF